MTYPVRTYPHIDCMGKHVAKVRSFCPICRLYYQRSITARELLTGGGAKSILCDVCEDLAIEDLAEFVAGLIRSTR